MSPLHAGNALATGPDTAKGLPQLSFTVGGVGATASAGQATVETVFAGMVTVGGRIVVVCVHV